MPADALLMLLQDAAFHVRAAVGNVFTVYNPQQMHELVSQPARGSTHVV